MSRQIMQQALEALESLKYAAMEKAVIALRKALDAEFALDKKADNARELGLDYEPEQEKMCVSCGKPTMHIGDKCYGCCQTAQKDHGFDRTASHMAGEYVDTAQPEQEPVKKALRLKPHECICGYSVGHPLVPKCICKPEYTAAPKRDVDTNQQNVNTSEERVQKSDKSIHERKYPNHETYCGRCGACTYKPWVGLTDDELNNISEYGNTDWTKRKSLARAIEAKLREKNG